ncbi:MAG: GIY-YIG nuclease family protein [Nostocales cyanobacterium]|nr:MAG: GIY-YIG nuclease family protein [Nostocales cyanobacterium]TAF13762.1 MAG: GIY-YIG nuclease family protein [Nostocales cyanobacterium]
MTSENNIPALAGLEYTPYIDDNGELPEQLQGKIGVYAIFDQAKILQFVGYSRDVYLSCKQHLVRVPEKCYWLKVHTIDSPKRSVLEQIEKEWIAENQSLPVGNGENQEKWTNAIDTKQLMTLEEQNSYQDPLLDELAKIKLVKNVARRVEAEILAVLESRGVKTQLRFNPKLKETGLLDLK